MTNMARMAFDARIDAVLSSCDDASTLSATAAQADIQLCLYDNLSEVERDWRAFEQHADCTAFQTFDWLSTWQRHIGEREGVKPAIVIGRNGGQTFFILPFALTATNALRRVTWLGADLCNSNAPLLHVEFANRVGSAQFVPLWRAIEELLRSRLRYDLVDLSKIPATVGAQANPMLALQVSPHANDAYVVRFVGNWDEFYHSKRSPSWRKTDGKKRRRLEKFGEIKFSTAVESQDIERTLDALIEQKKTFYANLGVANMFVRPGYRDFFLDMARDPERVALVHVGSISVGPAIVAASFGLTFHGNYDYILAGYSTGELEACSPGNILLQALMRYFVERGIKTFDFNIGDEPYKREWYDFELNLYDYSSPATFAGCAATIVMQASRILKRYIKRNRSIWPVIRKLRSLIGSLRR
jgi:CelD/BcsL family acetyltransferase involved in cellulose biosynthesis